MTLTEVGPAFASTTFSCTVLVEPYSARSSASVPALWPTPPVTTSPNGCGPTGTVGAATRTVHTPVAGALTSTSSSTLRVSAVSAAPPVVENPPANTLPLYAVAPLVTVRLRLLTSWMAAAGLPG